MSQQLEINFTPIWRKENNPESQKYLEENTARFSKQCKKIYDILKSGERLTVKKAILEYNIGDLRRRIKDLQDTHKIPIKRRRIEGHFKEYWLEF